MSKYANPLWQTNPVLAQAREALKEVEHIRTVLKTIESVAEALPSRAGADDLNAATMKVLFTDPYLKTLDGWCSSLTESEIGLHAMLELSGHRTETFAQQRKRFIDEQAMKWAAIMTGRATLKIGTRVAGFLRNAL